MTRSQHPRVHLPALAVAVALASALLACSKSSSSDNAGDGGAPGDPGAIHGGGTDAGGTDAGNDRASLAAEAYVWGYALVVSERTMQTLGALLGVNRLGNSPTLAGVASRSIVSPNQDTLYSVAVLDLRGEPMVLTVPDATDRYWTYQFLDTWSDSVGYIGTRATQGKGGSFAITPPGFTGTLPADVEKIEATTPQMFVLGRYLIHDAADAANVLALRRTLQPLSAVTGDAAPPPPPALGTAPGAPQDVRTLGAAFFDELGDVLAINPPATDADRAHLARFASLGIGPDLHPAAAARKSDAAALTVLEDGAREGESRIDAAAHGAADAEHPWLAHLDIGIYDDDPLLRAAIAKVLWGANVPEESVYAASRVDVFGEPYNSQKRYLLHFDAANLPPVKSDNGFWSLTLYGPDHFFTANAINRFAIGDRTPGLAFNADGSLDIYIQSDSPRGHEDNWLPAPGPSGADWPNYGPFSLMLRFYLPEQSVLDGTYAYPSVTPN